MFFFFWNICVCKDRINRAFRDACLGHDDAIDVDRDGTPDDCDALIDNDGDGVANDQDQCEGHDDTVDQDNDTIPDDCDALIDNDGDGVSNDEDQCEGHEDSIDADEDGTPDGCDEFIELEVQEEENLMQVNESEEDATQDQAREPNNARLKSQQTIVLGALSVLVIGIVIITQQFRNKRE